MSDSEKNEKTMNCQGNNPRSPEIASSAPDGGLPPRSATLPIREYVAPRHEVEVGVAEILAGLLMVERVGVHDNFILLGGESLLAAQAAWRIQNRFGCEVTLRSILAGTVENIAAEILAADRGQQS